MIARQIIRNVMTSAVRAAHHQSGGIPGSNLPFSITNRYKLTAYFILFFGSGFALPFIAVRYQMLK
ncbi:cytochrome c oxidase subunit 7C, mitochondrial [Orussus abietinus]|uniref:cytochrome c oxidase subunit 7C, mitochondrial n=1 Tax=Orussus abietinus TaxID=222816 RepID=UPI000626AFA3|nr:cytochrome c oxidase subunit 7C, mitochondrial [Orussus abietinus]